ncbi:MAG: Ig-like domain repeat protein [Nocardioides sp.]|nr:Ig-like domain repeat protein [Nocardioides sp.]
MPVPRVLLFLTAGALATGGALTATGAAYAQSDPLTYTCQTALGAAASTVVTDTDLPDVMHVGDSQPVGLTSTVTVPWAGAIQLAHDALGARTVQGTATANGVITGPGGYDVSTTTNLTVPSTPITANTDLTIASSGTGDVFAPTVPGVYTISAGDFTSVLTFLKDDGTDFGLGPQTIPCTAPSDVSTVVDTVTVRAHSTTLLALSSSKAAHGQPVSATAHVTTDSGAAAGSVAFTAGGKTVTAQVSDGTASATLPALQVGTHKVTATFTPDDTSFDASSSSKTLTVTKANSTSSTTARYHKRVKQVTASSKVRGAFGNDPSGRVSFVLKRGKHKVAAKSAQLNADNVAQVTFRKVSRPGNYSVTTRYAGNANLNGSGDKATFTVPR